MFYYLFNYLDKTFDMPGAGMFSFISFRAGLAFMTALIFSTLVGKKIIDKLLFEDDEVYVSGSPWSGKEDCYKNKQVPLKAIFFVEQAPENSVQKMSVAESFSHLYLNNYLVPFDNEMEKKHQNAVIRLASNVPVYRLKCTISKEAVEVAHNIVFNNK